jgi:diguanylate cyclase
MALSSLLHSALRHLWGDDPKTRIRLQQWSVVVAIYLGSMLVIGVWVAAGWLSARAFALWCTLVVGGLGSFYAAIRSGWSRRFVDGAMTEAQIAFAVVTVLWGYATAGDMRSPTLFPLMVILTFGAFSLGWRRMFALAGLSLAAMAATMGGMHHVAAPGRLDWRVDIANLMIAAVMLPASSAVAGLLGALRRRMRQQRAELTAALERIQELAIRDELTTLANRRHAQTLLEVERRRSARSGRPHVVAIVDVDHFKRINDSQGHGEGDKALQRFAIDAVALLRAHDVVARWGGEEFLILMPETTLATACDAMERLREAVAAAPPPGGGPPFTVSVGVAESRPHEPVLELVARADRALYVAKRRGRDRVVADSPTTAGEIQSPEPA